ANLQARVADPVSRNAAQVPTRAKGITAANTHTDAVRALASVRPTENPARLAATPEIAAPAAEPVWRTAVIADEPMARSSSESAPSRRRLMNAQENPNAAPMRPPPSSTHARW